MNMPLFQNEQQHGVTAAAEPDKKYMGIKSHLRVEQRWCFVCGQIKPLHPNYPNDTVDLRHDWRKADRPRLEDPLPKTEMCFACFCRIQAEYAPVAPHWDEDGVKHYPTPEEIAERRKLYDEGDTDE